MSCTHTCIHDHIFIDSVETRRGHAHASRFLGSSTGATDLVSVQCFVKMISCGEFPYLLASGHHAVRETFRQTLLSDTRACVRHVYTCYWQPPPDSLSIVHKYSSVRTTELNMPTSTRQRTPSSCQQTHKHTNVHTPRQIYH